MAPKKHEAAILAGLDIGNGYVKAALQGHADKHAEKFDMPAGVAMVTGRPDLQTPDAAAYQAVQEDFYNHLDVSFQTDLIGTSYRHLLGHRGLKADASLFVEFDVHQDVSKADQELSKVFILGLFAGKAVKDFVVKHGVLPQEELVVEAEVGLALPIDEYRERRVPYASALRNGVHLVTVHNFETPISVRIKIIDVQIVAEGSSAQFAIQQSGVALTKAMLHDLAQQGQHFDHITADDVYAATNTIGIDIGEGTVNFPVYTDGSFNGDVSRTFAEGYGHVLHNAMPDLRKAGKPFTSRKKLASYLLQEPSAMKRAEYNKINAIVTQHAELWAEAVVREFAKVFEDVRYTTEVAYVYGGGSGPMRDVLYPKLLELVDDAFPILYLDARYSRHLNREGLLIAARMARQLQEQQAKNGASAKASA